MFCYVKENLLLPDVNWTKRRPFNAGYIGEISEEFQTDFFFDCIKDGIIVPTTSKDKDLQKADEAPVVVRRGEKAEEKEEAKVEPTPSKTPVKRPRKKK